MLACNEAEMEGIVGMCMYSLTLELCIIRSELVAVCWYRLLLSTSAQHSLQCLY